MLFLKLTEEELKVVEALNAKVAWGPTTDQMDEITKLASDYSKRQKILDKIFESIKETNKLPWKQVYKALLLVEHMTIHADNDCVRYFKDNVRYIAQLKDTYKFRDDDGVDKGINVRKRAEQVADLIMDEQLEEKRQEGQAQKAKYSACVSSEGGHISRNEPFSGLPRTSKYDSMDSSSYQAPKPVHHEPQPQNTYQPPAPQQQF